jgi:hypothetical protein
LSTDGDYAGLLFFVMFFHRYLRIFVVKNRKPVEVLQDCGWCLAFLGYWHKSIVDFGQKHNYASNFLTNETFQDMIISLNNVVLMVAFFAQYLPNVKLGFSRLSSRFVEYMFQYLRLGGPGHNINVCVGSALNKLRTFDALLELESKDLLLPDIKSKRGMPRSKERIAKDWNKAEAGYYPNVDDLVKAIEAGVAELRDGVLKKSWGNGSDTFTPWDNFKAPSRLDQLASKHLLKKRITVPGGKWNDHFPTYKEGTGDVGRRAPEAVDEGDDGIDEELSEEGLGLVDDMPVVGAALGRILFPVLDDDEDSDDDDLDADVHDAHAVDGDGVGGGGQVKQNIVLSNARRAMANILKGTGDKDVDGNTIVDASLLALVKYVRQACNYLNGMIGRQGADRVAGRFLPLELREHGSWCSDVDTYFTSDDPVCLVYKSHDNSGYEIWFGIIEKCTRDVLGPRGGGSKPENASMVHCEDKGGKFRIRFFETVEDTEDSIQLRCDSTGRLKFKLPMLSTHGLNENATTENVYCAVALELDESSGFYLLDKEDERVCFAWFERYKATDGKCGMEDRPDRGRVDQ